MKKARLAVSIVTYHTDTEELAVALDCVDNQVVSRIDIIDNASEERIASAVKNRPKVTYYAAENRGYGAGHNVSLHRSLGDEPVDYHLVMNSDLEFDPAVLSRMVDYLDAHPDVGAMHPRMIDAHGNELYSVRALPTPADLIVRRFMPRRWFTRRRMQYELRHLDRSAEHDVQYMQGSFMLLRISTLREVGLFDERFFLYPEDIDLTRRIAAVSRAVYYPGAIVKHYHRASSYHNLRLTWVHIVNMVRYFNKWGWV